MTIEAENKHGTAFNENIREVDRLWKIHKQITTKGPGRKYDVQILHKSAIVLLVACWEAFVEDLAEQALTEMINGAKDHSVFPRSVLERVASTNSGMASWKLAGDGWKRVLRGNLEGVLKSTTGKLNTPRTAQTNDLFKKTIGLENISKSWYWPGRSISQAEGALDLLVTLRGSIAHRVTTASSVTLKHVKDSRGLINRIAVKSHNRTCDYLKERIGKSPWRKLQFGATS